MIRAYSLCKVYPPATPVAQEQLKDSKEVIVNNFADYCMKRDRQLSECQRLAVAAEKSFKELESALLGNDSPLNENNQMTTAEGLKALAAMGELKQFTQTFDNATSAAKRWKNNEDVFQLMDKILQMLNNLIDKLGAEYLKQLEKGVVSK